MKRILVLITSLVSISYSVGAQISTISTTKASSNNNSTQWSVKVTPVAGDALLVGCNFNSGIKFVSLSDSVGDIFTQIAPEADSRRYAARAFLATNVRGGSTTVTCSAASGPANNEIYVTELKGVNSSSPIDRVVSLGGSSSSAAGSLTTSNVNEFLWTYIVSGQVTNTKGWTSLSGFDGNLVTSKAQASPGSVSASFPVTMDWTLVVAAVNSGNAVDVSQPISVTLSPSISTVQISRSASFTASVQNDNLTKGVTWSLSGAGCSASACGSVTNATASSATYTAPATLPSPASVTLLATSVTDSTKSASASITVSPIPPISVSVAPATATVQAGQSSPFAASLQNDTLGKGAVWSLSGAACSGATCGSLTNVTTSSVTYNAPSTLPSPASVTLLATSAADSTKSASASIIVSPIPPISVSVAPATATVQASQSSPFTASLQSDALGKGVVWSLSGSGCSGVTCGSLTNVTASSATYNAPTTVPSPASVTLLAMSLADSTKSAIAAITVSPAPPISVSTSPATATIQVSQAAPFTATLQNDTLGKGVVWSLSGAGCSGSTCGTLSGVAATSATYTAPSAAPNPSTVTLTATSVADSTKTSTSTISVSAALAQPTITTVGTTKASATNGSKQWSVGITPQAGDTLVVGCDFNPGIAFVGVSDAAGDAFTQIAPEADSTDFAARAYLATNVQGGSTTVTCSAATGPSNTEIYVTELKGVSSSAPIDKALSTSGSKGSASGSLSTTNPNEFLWAYTVSGQVSNANSWTQLSNFDGNLVTSLTQATPAAVLASFSVTMNWTLINVALNPAGTGVPPPAISVSVAPATSTVQTNGSQTLAATLQNDAPNHGVTWSLSGSGCSGSACGTLTNITTSSATYNAPRSVPAPSSVSVTATSVTDTSKSAAASLTVTAGPPPISISVSPAANSVQVSQSTVFSAALQNDSQNKGVTWSLSGSGCVSSFCGTLSSITSSSVTYSAPAAPPNPAAVTLRATSIADTTKSASATISIATLPPTVPANLTTAANGSSEIDLNWSASTDALGISAYLVERCQVSGCSNFVQVASAPGTSFNDTGLAASTSYSYRVRATDSANNLSPYSNITSASTLPTSSGGGAVPTLVWSKSAASTIFISTQGYTSHLPTNGTLPGNALIATFQYTSNTGASATVTDDKGDTLPLLKTNSNGNQTVSTYCIIPTAGTRALALTFSGAMPQYVSMINASEWFNLTCTLDGSSASSNFLASVAAGSLTTSSDGDLIYQAAEEDGSTFTEQWFQGSAPWTLLSASRGLSGANIPQATQYQVQTAHGAINPTFSMSVADSWNSVAIALKSANSGTPPPAGIRIVHLQEESVPPGQSSTVPLQFPSSGNLIITASIDGPGFDISGISDSNGNIHTQIGGFLSDGFASGDVQTFYAANAVTSSTLALTFSMTGSPTGGSTFFLYDVTGASSSPYDSAAGRQSDSGNQQSTGNILGPIITPSTANGLVIMQIAVTTNSINGVSPGNFAATVPNPLDQTNPTDENNGWGFEYNSSTAPRQYIWTTQGSGGVGGWCSSAVAFRAP